MPKPLGRLQAILQRGLTETAALWPDVRVAYRWVHRAAYVLTNEAHHPGTVVKQCLGGMLGAMTRHRAAAGTLASALAHFLKVSRSYWPGLFHCYEVPDLPRTKPALVLRGSVQLLAATAARLRVFAAWELAPEDVSAWQSLRHDLETRRQRRTLRRRFRRDPCGPQKIYARGMRHVVM